MKKQFHTPEGIVERDLTAEELEAEKIRILNQPGLMALIRSLIKKFPALATLEADVKKEIIL